MSGLYGYAGKILRVDLSTGVITAEELDPEVARKFIGGTGLGIKYIYDEVPPQVQWDDPENRLCIASGPLGGTDISGSGTVSVVTRGPMTNGASGTQPNGLFGAFLRFCGYDAVIVQGQSPDWVYLHVKEDGTAELKSAAHLLGLDTWETCDKLKAELGKTKRTMSVACIGPAGEHLVRYAMTFVDKEHAASSNGTGAVLGAKRLKAIAVDKGRLRPHLADKEALLKVAAAIHEDIEWTAFGSGTNVAMDSGGIMASGSGNVNNYQKGYLNDPELMDKLDKMGSTWLRDNCQGKLDTTCWACNSDHCYAFKVTDGPFAGDEASEPEVEATMCFGPNIGNYDNWSTLFLANYVDRLGLDVNEAGWVIGFMMECVEHGVLGTEDLDGLEMTWGNWQAARQMLDKIAQREGVGDLAAEGVMRMALKLGGEALRHGVFLYNGGTPRHVAFKKTWAIILDHVIAENGKNNNLVFLGDPSTLGLDCSLGDNYRGVDLNYDQTVEVNVKTGWSGAFVDSLGICWFPAEGNMALLLPALRAATGWEISNEEVIAAGLRIVTLLHAFNLRCGLTPDKAAPSEAMTREADVGQPPRQYDLSDRLEELKADYYQGMGWERETSKPLAQTLRELGLEYVIPDFWS